MLALEFFCKFSYFCIYFSTDFNLFSLVALAWLGKYFSVSRASSATVFRLLETIKVK